MLKINKKKGFTLIELLVVIAIIGILASVVLASLNTARNKGADTNVKGNLSGLRAQAELIYDDTNSYATICSDTTSKAQIDSAKAAAGVTAATNSTIGTAQASSTAVCHATGAGWAVSVPLKTSGYFCVDGNGISTTTSVTLAANDVSCI